MQSFPFCPSVQLDTIKFKVPAANNPLCKKRIMGQEWTMDSYNQHFTSDILHSSAPTLSTGGEPVKGFRLILSRSKDSAVKQVKSLATNWIQIPPHFSAKIDSDKPALLPPYLSMEIFG